MPNPTAAMLTIGDEILSGRTRDANLHHLAQALAEVGIDLREARVAPDDPAEIGAAARALAARYDHVFTSGGIGPTHDDVTADAIAAAFGAEIDVRADARAILAAHYAAKGLEFNAARMRMARIPDGAVLIENAVSKAPGFSLGNVHVMAGVPAVFASMLAWLLPRLAHGAPLAKASLRAAVPEGVLAGPLAALARAHPAVAIGCYPYQEDGAFGATIVLRAADPVVLAAAEAAAAAMIADLGRG